MTLNLINDIALDWARWLEKIYETKTGTLWLVFSKSVVDL